jgi:hypothetical protein
MKSAGWSDAVNSADKFQQHLDELWRFRWAKLNCMITAQSVPDPTLRSFWLTAAESYATLERSCLVLNPHLANAGTDRRSGDSNCTMPLPVHYDR